MKETAKQETIRKAYGEHWEQVKDHVDESGWVRDIHCGPDHSLPIPLDWVSSSYCRPKSISGVQHNRGWKSIEKEEDLPPLRAQYWVIVGGLIVQAFLYRAHCGIVWALQDDIPGYEDPLDWNSITRYQEIVIPPLPVY